MGATKATYPAAMQEICRYYLPMFYTPGWGALLTAVATLSGVAITQWNANRQTSRTQLNATRIEQRQVVLEILEAVAVLETKLRRFAATLDKGKKALEDGTFNHTVDDFYSQSYREAIDQGNALTRALRKGELVITDKKMIYVLQQLRNSAKELARVRTEAGRTAEEGNADSAALRAATTSLYSNGVRLSTVTRRQLARNPGQLARWSR